MADQTNGATRKPAGDPPAPTGEGKTEALPPGRVPRTRTGAAWIGLCAGALAFVVLIIFMLQNTDGVEITFLGWRGTLPLAMALLIAAVGSAIITAAIGTARIAQLRRRLTHQHN